LSVWRVCGPLLGPSSCWPCRLTSAARVRLHVDLTILAQLATALAKAMAVPLAA